MNNVQQSMDYYLTGGDAETRRLHLKVLPAPTVTSVAIDLAFPSYTKVPPRTNIEGGTVEAIVGTTVTVHATTNMPAQIANLNLNTSSEPPPPMDISGADSKVLTGTFIVKENGSYTIQFHTSGGQSNPSPVNYDIIAIPDRAPTAKFLQPERPDIKVPANVKVDLVMNGTDDHGIKDATVSVKLGNEVLLSKNVLEGRPAEPEFRATETLDLPQLGIKPGATLTYKMTVRDNKEPSSNKTETEQRVIQVIEPVTPAEKQTIEENQRKQAEQQNPAPGASPETQTPAEDNAGKTPEETDKPRPDAGTQPPPDEQAARTKGEDTEKGVKDTGANSSDSTNQPGQANPDNALPPLTPEKQRQIQQIMNDLAKKNQANKGNQPNEANSPSGKNGDQARPPAAPNASNTSGENQPSKPGERPQLQNPTTPNPSSGNAPEKGSGQNDPTNQVKRATRERTQPPGAGTNNDDQTSASPEAQRNPTEPTAPGQSGKKPGTEAGTRPDQAIDGSRPGQDNPAAKNDPSPTTKDQQDRSAASSKAGNSASGEQGERNPSGSKESNGTAKTQDASESPRRGNSNEKPSGDGSKDGQDGKGPQKSETGESKPSDQKAGDRQGGDQSRGEASNNARSRDMTKGADNKSAQASRSLPIRRPATGKAAINPGARPRTMPAHAI